MLRALRARGAVCIQPRLTTPLDNRITRDSALEAQSLGVVQVSVANPMWMLFLSLTAFFGLPQFGRSVIASIGRSSQACCSSVARLWFSMDDSGIESVEPVFADVGTTKPLSGLPDPECVGATGADRRGFRPIPFAHDLTRRWFSRPLLRGLDDDFDDRSSLLPARLPGRLGQHVWSSKNGPKPLDVSDLTTRPIGSSNPLASAPKPRKPN